MRSPLKPTQMTSDEIHPGLTFFFAKSPNADEIFASFDIIDKSVAWTVIGKEYVMKNVGGWWRYCLLGPGPSVVWSEGNPGWIHIVVDPK